jgi:hypothetical protein
MLVSELFDPRVCKLRLCIKHRCVAFVDQVRSKTLNSEYSKLCKFGATYRGVEQSIRSLAEDRDTSRPVCHTRQSNSDID